MAKREAPEINAGSMADIAFLLLIFFLVTTTMDKDQAFLRSIPKKVINPPTPPPVFERNICAIMANSSNQLLFRGKMMSNPEDISEGIVEFYKYNQKGNDLASNFPMYTWATKAQIEGELAKVEAEIERMESSSNQSQEILDYQYQALDDWQKKYDAFKLYGRDKLPEVDLAAHVRIEVQKNTSYDLFTKIHTEVQEAIRVLRDEESKKLWNLSYDVISKKVDSDPKDMVSKNQLELLKVLYNVRIIEVSPKK